MLKTCLFYFIGDGEIVSKKAARKKKKGIFMMDLIKLGAIKYNWTWDALTNYPPQNKTKKKKKKREDLN